MRVSGRRVPSAATRLGCPVSDAIHVTTWHGTVDRKFSAADFDDYVTWLDLGDFYPEFVVVHNTQIPTKAQWKGEESIQSLVRYYRDEQKWSGGPHLFVEENGIWVFTPLSVPGVHSPSWNRKAWGLEIVGDFDKEQFTAQHKMNVVSALTSLHKKARWLTPQIKLHKEDPATTHKDCPGKAVVKAELEAGVAAALKEDELPDI